MPPARKFFVDALVLRAKGLGKTALKHCGIKLSFEEHLLIQGMEITVLKFASNVSQNKLTEQNKIDVIFYKISF